MGHRVYVRTLRPRVWVVAHLSRGTRAATARAGHRGRRPPRAPTTADAGHRARLVSRRGRALSPASAVLVR
jgi:hypothetical protein